MKNQNTPRKQLQAFYAAQGLTGKHARKAVAHDLRLARREFAALPGDLREGWKVHCRGGLGALFVWANSPQGHVYWQQRAEAQIC